MSITNTRKLKLHKETLRRLNGAALAQVAGGSLRGSNEPGCGVTPGTQIDTGSNASRNGVSCTTATTGVILDPDTTSVDVPIYFPDGKGGGAL